MSQNDHEHDHSQAPGRDHGKPRHSPAAGVANWRRSDLTFAGKLRLALRNNLTKLRNRSSCCGHPGEPGC